MTFREGDYVWYGQGGVRALYKVVFVDWYTGPEGVGKKLWHLEAVSEDALYSAPLIQDESVMTYAFDEPVKDYESLHDLPLGTIVLDRGLREWVHIGGDSFGHYSEFLGVGLTGIDGLVDLDVIVLG